MLDLQTLFIGPRVDLLLCFSSLARLGLSLGAARSVGLSSVWSPSLALSHGLLDAPGILLALI
jgi:hypothetical protein